MFKICPLCEHPWKDRENFLTDPGLTIVGYQARFDDENSGLFLFNHTCETTLAVEVELFDDLYKGPRYDEPLTGTDECSELCLHTDELSPRGARCKYAFLREIIQIIKNWPKA